jgi:hypothetical protein
MVDAGNTDLDDARASIRVFRYRLMRCRGWLNVIVFSNPIVNPLGAADANPTIQDETWMYYSPATGRSQRKIQFS